MQGRPRGSSGKCASRNFPPEPRGRRAVVTRWERGNASQAAARRCAYGGERQAISPQARAAFVLFSFPTGFLVDDQLGQRERLHACGSLAVSGRCRTAAARPRRGMRRDSLFPCRSSSHIPRRLRPSEAGRQSPCSSAACARACRFPTPRPPPRSSGGRSSAAPGSLPRSTSSPHAGAAPRRGSRSCMPRESPSPTAPSSGSPTTSGAPRPSRSSSRWRPRSHAWSSSSFSASSWAPTPSRPTARRGRSGGRCPSRAGPASSPTSMRSGPSPEPRRCDLRSSSPARTLRHPTRRASRCASGSGRRWADTTCASFP